jgi:hypothetical protein
VRSQRAVSLPKDSEPGPRACSATGRNIRKLDGKKVCRGSFVEPQDAVRDGIDNYQYRKSNALSGEMTPVFSSAQSSAYGTETKLPSRFHRAVDTVGDDGGWELPQANGNPV